MQRVWQTNQAMQFVVNGVPMNIPGMGVPGMGVPGMGGMRMHSQAAVSPVDVQQPPQAKAANAVGIVPTSEWSADDIALISPRQIGDYVYESLKRGLGEDLVKRQGSQGVLVIPRARPNALSVRIKVKFTTIVMTLSQEGAPAQEIALETDRQQTSWREWVDRITKQIVEQAK